MNWVWFGEFNVFDELGVGVFDEFGVFWWIGCVLAYCVFYWTGFVLVNLSFDELGVFGVVVN